MSNIATQTASGSTSMGLWGSSTRVLIDWIILACRAAWPSEGAPLDMWDAGSQ